MKPEALSQRIEECALNAWPALQQTLCDGWVLRFADGYTKRANSVNAVYPGTLELGKKIAFCEAAYQRRGLRPTFRLTSFSAPYGLDEALAEHGYQVLDPTDVLFLELEGQEMGSASQEMSIVHLDTWMAAFCEIGGRDPAAQATHRRILDAILGERLLALRYEGDTAVSCGLGVLEDGFLGIFDVATLPARRNGGHATRLIRAMLGWAREHGARTSYLQVMKSNLAAQRLYSGLGFSRLYDYWYRVLDASAAPMATGR